MSGNDAATGPRHGPSPWLVDGAVALGLLAVMVIGMVGGHPVEGQRPDGPVSAVLVLATVAAYLVHRRLPMVALAVGLAAVLAYSLLRFPAYPGFGAFVLLFVVTLRTDRRRGLVALAATFAVMMVALAAQPPGVTTDDDWISTGLLTVVAYLLGENFRLSRTRLSALRGRTELLERERALAERERDERARQAVVAERLRIARELHDAVAHAMSVVAVQAGTGHHVIDSQPEEAKRALGAIETTTREALVEMRRMLGVLRQEGQPDATLEPGHGVAQVPDLVAAAGDGGVRAALEVHGEPCELPAGVDLSVYRIVQEALTNVIRHGGDAATVTLAYGADQVGVEITDDGAPAATAAADGALHHLGGGQGLIGMHERVAVLGGRLDAGPVPGGGFRVVATLPTHGGPR